MFRSFIFNAVIYLAGFKSIGLFLCLIFSLHCFLLFLSYFELTVPLLCFSFCDLVRLLSIFSSCFEIYGKHFNIIIVCHEIIFYDLMHNLKMLPLYNDSSYILTMLLSLLATHLLQRIP